jgi:glucose-1-phosphate adenylyltransferase
MENKAMALILAGGRGKRMDILSDLTPKPALPFAGNLRVIDFTTGNCLYSRIENIAVLVDYRREAMADYLTGWHVANGCRADLSIRPPRAGSYTGTADAVYRNLDYVARQNADTVLVLAGDHVYRMDYRRMIDFHRKMKADATVAVIRVPVKDTHRFGTVTVAGDGRITEFKEKTSIARSNLASMGIYIFDTDRLARRLGEDASEPGSLHDFGYNVLPRMVRTDRVFAYEFKGYWYDIGTIESYYEANMELLAPRSRLTFDGGWPVPGGNRIRPMSCSSHNGSIINSIVSPGCVIEGRVVNSILSPGVYIGAHALVRNSLVMADSCVGFHSIVSSCVVDEKVDIGKYCYIGFGAAPGDPAVTVLGRDVTVPDRTAISHRSGVCPGLDPESYDTRQIPSGTTVIVPARGIKDIPVIPTNIDFRGE